MSIIVISMLVNYSIGSMLFRMKDDIEPSRKKIVLFIGIAFNLILLCYYKYTNFLIDNFNYIFGLQWSVENIILPLAISFFTFQQIAYLVDCNKGEAKEYNFLNYSLFVTFFPQLIAGPIVHHREMMTQFESKSNLQPKLKNINLGILIFSLGLFKKVVIADSFATWADIGFSSDSKLDFYDAWVTSLSYTFQLYFDFSGYCDMAIGTALLFNIRLPINFNSPYKSLDIQDFWRRWHITLGRFLRDYIYIPLGGSRKGDINTYFSLFITFLIGGLWHGASWMFVLWGALHGGALVIHRIWKQYGGNLNSYLAWTITFFFVNFSWIFFRAEDIDVALNIIYGLFDISSILSDRSSVPVSQLSWLGTNVDILNEFMPFGLATNLSAVMLIILSFIIIAQKNSIEMIGNNLTNAKSLFCGLMFSLSVYTIITSTSSVFLYFNF